MAGATELLRLVIDADGKGAITELQKVGAASDKELGRTTSNLDKVGATMSSVGVGMVAGAAVAGAGLYKLAQSASNYGEQVSAATKIFGEEAVAGLEDFAKAASDTAGISSTAALTAANNFGTFGKAAGLTGEGLSKFSTDLTQLAGDLASFKNTTPQEAAEALGAALRGESEPLRRYGVLLDDAALKAEAMSMGIYNGTGPLDMQTKILAANSAIMQQTSDAQGDFADTSDSLANRQRQLAADFENTKVALGEGLLPLAEGGIGIVQGLGDAFGNLSPEMQKVVGSVAGFAALGVGGLGGLSFIIGQSIKMRDTFSTVGAKLRDVDGNLTTFGTTASRVGQGLAGGALAVGLYTIASGINDATRDLRAFKDVTETLTFDGTATDFRAIHDAIDAANGSIDEAQNKWLNWSGIVATVDLGDGMGEPLSEVKRTIDAMIDDGNLDQARQLIDAVTKSLNDPDLNNNNFATRTYFDDFKNETLPGLSTEIDRAAKAQGDLNTAAGTGAGNQANLATETDKVRESMVNAKDAVDGYSDRIKAMTDPLFGALDAMKQMGKSRDQVTWLTAVLATQTPGTEEYKTTLLDLADAQQDGIEAARDQELAMATLAGAVASNEVPMSEAILRVQEWASQVGLSQPAADAFVAELEGAVARAQAVASEKVVDLPVRVETSGVWEFAKSWGGWKPETKVLPVLPGAPISFGAFGEAANTPPLPGAAISFGNTPRRASGGPVIAGQEYMVGERGPELWRAPANGTIIPNHQLPMQADQPLIGEYHVHGVESPQSPQQLASDARFVKALVR